MDYPYKYFLFVEVEEGYSQSNFNCYYCDYAEAIRDFDSYVELGYKCCLYRILQFDNFDL